MREVQVRLSKSAVRDMLDLGIWWRTHHPGKPDLFGKEFEAAVQLLRQFPEAAPPARTKRYKGARVRVLIETGHLVVYRYSDRTVTVLGVFASRATSARP